MQIQHYFCSFLFIFERLPNLLYDFFTKTTSQFWEYLRNIRIHKGERSYVLPSYKNVVKLHS